VREFSGMAVPLHWVIIPVQTVLLSMNYLMVVIYPGLKSIWIIKVENKWENLYRY
jgi:hypothetical protein